MSDARTFIELTIVESGLSSVPVPRRFLVDAALIASIEDMGDNPYARSHVTLYEAADATIESEAGEQVARCAKSLLAIDTYDEIKAQLAALAAVVPSKCAVESVLSAVAARAQDRNG